MTPCPTGREGPPPEDNGEPPVLGLFLPSAPAPLGPTAQQHLRQRDNQIPGDTPSPPSAPNAPSERPASGTCLGGAFTESQAGSWAQARRFQSSARPGCVAGPVGQGSRRLLVPRHNSSPYLSPRCSVLRQTFNPTNERYGDDCSPTSRIITAARCF